MSMTINDLVLHEFQNKLRGDSTGTESYLMYILI